MSPNDPNRGQAALWNETSGPTWVEMQEVLDRMLAPFETLLVERALPGDARRVLDVGCGAGATTLAMARRLGAGGHVVGVDISAPLIAAAEERARGRPVSFVRADAQTHRFEPGSFDAVISRFGVMFFDDPVAAFANLRSAAKPGAPLTFVAWRSPAENPFMTLAARTAAPFLPQLRAPDHERSAHGPPCVRQRALGARTGAGRAASRSADPEAPGQFAFADGERVRRILDASGWTAIDVGAIDVPSTLTAQDVDAYVTKLGPVGLALKGADEATRARTEEAVRAAFAPHVHDGEARFTAACWLVEARAPR